MKQTNDKVQIGSFKVNSDSLTDLSNEKGIYKGSWKANKMDGKGILKWASGRLYVGWW